MNDEIKNKMDALRAAQMAKLPAANFDTSKLQKPAPVQTVKPAPAPVKQAAKPELSTVYSADLISVGKAAVIPQKNGLTLVNYSDKAFALVGDTKPVKEQIKALGGSFNSRLTCGPGWIFSKKRLADVKKHFKI